MTLLYAFDEQGGFICGDTETGRTAYAYPTSTNATKALKNPAKIAKYMMDHENTCSRIWRDKFFSKDMERMEKLRAKTGAGQGLSPSPPVDPTSAIWLPAKTD